MALEPAFDASMTVSGKCRKSHKLLQKLTDDK